MPKCCGWVKISNLSYSLPWWKMQETASTGQPFELCMEHQAVYLGKRCSINGRLSRIFHGWPSSTRRRDDTDEELGFIRHPAIIRNRADFCGGPMLKPFYKSRRNLDRLMLIFAQSLSVSKRQYKLRTTRKRQLRQSYQKPCPGAEKARLQICRSCLCLLIPGSRPCRDHEKDCDFNSHTLFMF